jgi:hypothetical protein
VTIEAHQNERGLWIAAAMCNGRRVSDAATGTTRDEAVENAGRAMRDRARVTRPPLPAVLGLETWPEHAKARAALTRGLPTAARVALLAWAHATLPQPPTLAAWAQLAGVAEQGLRRARRLDDGLRALPVAGREPRDVATLAASSLRRRRSEARARGEDVPRLTPGRVPSTPAAILRAPVAPEYDTTHAENARALARTKVQLRKERERREAAIDAERRRKARERKAKSRQPGEPRRKHTVTIDGVERPASEVYRAHGVSRTLYHSRVNSGVDPVKAATTPPQKRRRKTATA